MSPTGADPAEAEAFLAAHPQVEAIDLVLSDCNGIARGKIIRRHELIGLYRGGRHLPISILGLDIMGEDVEGTGLIWDTGDGDLRAWPVAGSLRLIHGSAPLRAEVILSMYDLQGQPMGADPRHALARQIAGLAKMGLQPHAAFELEFYLTDLPVAGEMPAPKGGVDVYALEALHGLAPLITDIYAATKLADIPAETMISEYGAGQYELTLRYRSSMLQAADDLLRLKRIVRAQARRHGKLACFMAKPFEQQAGSGMHLHISLQGAAGNCFSESDAPFAPALLQALGGLMATMPDGMAVFAPHANSWRRFAAQSYAPMAANWGVNNRSVALRIPAGDRAARRIEHRLSGVDANPYLVGAVVLAGIAKGLGEGLDPGPPVVGNGYAAPPSGLHLPRDWRAALDIAQGSGFLQQALGPQMHRTFMAVKEAEYARVARRIPDVEYDLYLQRV